MDSTNHHQNGRIIDTTLNLKLETETNKNDFKLGGI